jgi:hypothetical protein
MKNLRKKVFLKPFEADRWILVSSPSPDREAVVTASGSRGQWHPASLTTGARPVRAVDAGVGTERAGSG